MKTTRIHLILAALATLSASEAAPKPAAPPMPPPHALQKALDGNKDREISADEIQNASTALLALDKNVDGAITPKELGPKPPKNAPPAPLLKALDLDRDGKISAEEIEAAPGSLLILDKDADGALSAKELSPGKPPVKKA